MIQIRSILCSCESDFKVVKVIQWKDSDVSSIILIALLYIQANHEGSHHKNVKRFMYTYFFKILNAQTTHSTIHT